MKARKVFWIALLIAVWFAVGTLVAAVVSAQEVTVTTGGTVSLTGTPTIYNGKYVLHQTDFGFLWLDSTALTGGHVQAEAKCGTGQPNPVTNIYVIGDCNTISSINTGGNVVTCAQFNGQCGAATRGCGGPRIDPAPVGWFYFDLGTWAFTGIQSTDVQPSSQTADLQGRTWSVRTNSLSSYTWYITGGGPTPLPQPTGAIWTPTPSSTPTWPAPAASATPLPSGTICGPTSSGQCYDCRTFQFVACPGSTLPTPTTTAAPPAPSATPTSIPATPSLTPTFTPSVTSVPTADSQPSASPVPTLTPYIPPTPTAVSHGSAGGCGKNSSASLSGLMVGLALLYFRRKKGL